MGTQFILSFSLSLSFALVFLSVSQMEEEPFNPDYVEVDRVLEVSYCEDKDTGEVKQILFHLVIISVSSVSVFICIYAFYFFSFLSFSFQYILHSSDVFVSQKCPRPS